jgi:hypothetical protein
MKAVALLMIVAGLLAAGCEYQAPLTDEHRMPVDPAVLGLWESVPDGYGSSDTNRERMIVLKYSETEYLVHYPTGKDGQYFRGYPMKIADVPCVQVQLIGAATGDVKNEAPKYHVVSYTLSNGELSLMTLNTAVVDKTLKGSAALRKAFEKNKDNKELFANPGKFRKVAKGD